MRVGKEKDGTHPVPDGSGTLRKLQKPIAVKSRCDNVTTSFSNKSLLFFKINLEDHGTNPVRGIVLFP